MSWKTGTGKGIVLMKAIAYYLFYCTAWLIALLPLRILYLLSDFFFLIVYYLIRYRQQIILTNLQNAFPDLSVTEYKEIHRKFIRHFCDVFTETLKLIHLNKRQVQKRMQYKNPEIIRKLYGKGKSIILVTGHYNNWEWYCGLPFVSQHQATAVYMPQSNRYFEAFINGLRSKFGLIPVPMKQILKLLLEYKEKKIPTISILVSDQIPTKNEISFWTTFLNQETAVYLGAEKIAKKTDQAVVFGKIQKIRRGYYEVEFIIICENPGETREYEITEAHVKLLEKIINNCPEHWMWSHRRWKHKRIEIEKHEEKQRA
ncbi:MAG: lysophospholipid acyltransferase family protein [Bacteroidetes bacterium]|nr:lysophospholipid acyltransferase family protein [Bacteroidota bacterium]